MSVHELEQAFSNRIDCRFPYDDVDRVAGLIAEAGEISHNATFILLYEIVCAPPSVQLPEGTQRRLLAKFSKAFPFISPVIDLAYRVLDGEKISTDQALALMREVGSNQNQPAALAVVSHLAYNGVGEADAKLVDALEQKIRLRWQAEVSG